MIDKDNLKQKLLDLAYNFWWTWHPEALEIWRRIDPVLWRDTRHSPIDFIERLDKDQMQRISKDSSLHITLNRIISTLNQYMRNTQTWGNKMAGALRARPVVYFCAEFGIHESLPFYSGGLGVLSGDHLKSVSDLGIPMIGISLLYREGYFRQRISDTGEQSEIFEKVSPENFPLTRVKDENGNPLTIDLEIREETVQIDPWMAQLGRIPLYFLDMQKAFRKLGFQEVGLRLYGGDETVRLAQEMILGIGGMRLINRLGIMPGVIHLNEGHCAFASLEYMRHLKEEHNLPFPKAHLQARGRTVFTTHTPVAAGHDRFSSDLIGKLTWKYRESLGISHDQLMDLGRVNPGDSNETFCMTVLALKTSCKSNAVSFIHGQVSRQMWSGLFTNNSLYQIPIGHITNGINVLGWLRPEMRELFHKYFPPGWEQQIGEEEIWELIHSIPDEELWHTVLLRKTRLIEFLSRLPYRAYPEKFDFDPHILTVGFARRFAEYKRPTLLLDDPERFLNLLCHPEYPVQIIFSGKAHPKDDRGKELVKRVCQFAQNSRCAQRMVFIEDYDINVCRHLVQSVDVWLNTPMQGYEACGTSGMKVALNGGLNLSILDGWWAEGYDGMNGFGVRGSRNENNEMRNNKDRELLFKCLEQEVIPLYYNRDEKDIPREWVRKVKEAMRTLGWKYSSDRMVMDYAKHCYKPIAGISTCHMDFPFI